MPGRLRLLPLAPVGMIRGQLIENLYDLTPRLFSTAVSAGKPPALNQIVLTGHIFAPAAQVIGSAEGGGTIFDLAWDFAEVVPYLQSQSRKCLYLEGLDLQTNPDSLVLPLRILLRFGQTQSRSPI